jgi:hypothetical protein
LPPVLQIGFESADPASVWRADYTMTFAAVNVP